ncbi:hypothetical protein [Nonomuraea sp. SYSU D8015]|uniref:hypothetical protein n=1 Tax=Nonomuraea sp. SYSU D8015 TaxID=2593644 RepID=UPI00166029A7|nr:hypothetical protein [Nonomuraea sp. SYSU D8015]
MANKVIRKSDGARGQWVLRAQPQNHSIYEWHDTQPMFAQEILPHSDVADPHDREGGRWGQVAELAQAASGAAGVLGEIAAHCMNGGWYNETERDAKRQLERLEHITALMRERVEAACCTGRNR